jgi:hypothetical protein
VSLAFTDLEPGPRCFEEIAAAAGQVADHYRYWEVLIVVEAASADRFQPLMKAVKNIRMIKVRTGVQTYQNRVVAASEAIGDIVLLAAAREVHAVDTVAMIEQARLENRVVIAERSGAHLLNPVIVTLGNVSGFRATTRDMATAAYPRTVLNRLLAFPDRKLALRFLPRDAGLTAGYVKVAPDRDRRLITGLGPRLGLIQRLLVNAAPRVLNITSLLAATTSIFALFFALYAVAVWMLLDDIQPGWFTTALAISLTASFLGVAIFGLSTGLLKIIDLISPELVEDVVGEDSSIDLFSQVMTELNVELNAETAALPEEQTTPTSAPAPKETHRDDA